MSKNAKGDDDREPEGYKETLRLLQIELVKLQRHLIKSDLQILILFEGRDSAGKDRSRCGAGHSEQSVSWFFGQQTSNFYEAIGEVARTVRHAEGRLVSCHFHR